jgi:hypothetical protein
MSSFPVRSTPLYNCVFDGLPWSITSSLTKSVFLRGANESFDLISDFYFSFGVQAKVEGFSDRLAFLLLGLKGLT